jgi:hypothetical protein
MVTYSHRDGGSCSNGEKSRWCVVGLSVILIMLVTHQKLRIKITKKQQDRIRNRFNLSFSIGAPNSRFKYDRIVLSYPVSLSCAPNGP